MKTYSHVSLRGPFSRAGFTLIEMAVVMVIVDIVISIIATVVPTLIRSAKIKQGQAVIEKVGYTIQGYITANGRLPFATLGLSSGDDVWNNRIKYGVNSDLTTTTKTTMGTVLGLACAEPADSAKLNVARSGGGTADEVLDSGSGAGHGRALGWGTGVRPSQTTPSSGKVCRSGVFTRVNNHNGGYIDLGDPAAGDLDPGTAPWTISAWINWDGGTSFPITANTWTYVTIVYDGYQQSLYKNGSRAYYRSQANAMGANAAKLLIGARGNNSPYNFFGGQIDEVRIYNRALAENEIGMDYSITRDCAADSVIITSTTLPAAVVGQTGWTSGVEPNATGAATATLRKTGVSTAANGYRFYLTATDNACVSNVLTSPSYTLNISAPAAPSP